MKYYTDDIEYTDDLIEKPYIDEVFRSRTLRSLFGDLDMTVCKMEDKIAIQKEEIRSLNQQIGEDLNRRIDEGHQMIANTLMACIDKPDINAIGSAGAIILSRIRDMQTIEEVKEYIDKLIN